MGSFYTISRSNVANSTTNDQATIITAANRKIAIVEVEVAGMGTASAANEVDVSRSTGGTTGGGALTPAALDPDSPTAASTVNTTWAAQPTLSGDPLLRLGVNANGGINRWVARPGQEIIARNAGQISVRGSVGTSNISIHVIFEEI